MDCIVLEFVNGFWYYNLYMFAIVGSGDLDLLKQSMVMSCCTNIIEYLHFNPLSHVMFAMNELLALLWRQWGMNKGDDQ